MVGHEFKTNTTCKNGNCFVFFFRVDANRLSNNKNFGQHKAIPKLLLEHQKNIYYRIQSPNDMKSWKWKEKQHLPLSFEIIVSTILFVFDYLMGRSAFRCCSFHIDPILVLIELLFHQPEIKEGKNGSK